jgi:Holliday junction DNA helicase RuvA
MFSYIKGRLAEVGTETVVIENGGLGWLINVPTTVINRLPAGESEVKMYVCMIVRDETPKFYGFLEKDEQMLFEMLLSVTGIGPKAALSILSTLAPAEFFLAIINENLKVLTRAPGIGQKSARRLIVELKEKVSELSKAAFPLAGTEASGTRTGDPASEAMAALLALGYTGTEAQQALQKVSKRGENLNAEEIIRRALSALAER